MVQPPTSLQKLDKYPLHNNNMVKNIPCPNCGTACPDEGPNAREDGTQLILTCPNPKCRRQFIVQRQRIKKPKNWNVPNPVFTKKEKQRR